MGRILKMVSVSTEDGWMLIRDNGCRHSYNCREQSELRAACILWDGRLSGAVPNCITTEMVNTILHHLGVSASQYIPKYELLANNGHYTLTLDGVIIRDLVRGIDIANVYTILERGFSYKMAHWGSIPPHHADAIFQAIAEADICVPKYKI